MDDYLKNHGVFSWDELMTSDVEGAKDFYGKLFGWEWVEYPTDMGTYWVVKAAGREIAGVMGLPPMAKGMPPMWGSYVTVDDVDKTVEKAKEMGGSVIVGPRDIPDTGRFAVLQDPQGAVLNVITYSEKVLAEK